MWNVYEHDHLELEEEESNKKMADKEVFIASLDQGTTSTRFMIYDHSARVIGSHQVEFTQFYPKAG